MFLIYRIKVAVLWLAAGADMRDYISCRGRLLTVDKIEKRKEKSHECDQSAGR